MNEKGAARDDDDARTEALFRYRLLALLLDPRETEPLRARVDELARCTHEHPKHGPIRVSSRTLWTWLGRLRRGGLEALHPCARSDKGSVRALSVDALDRAEALRREIPARWTSTVRDILVLENVIQNDEGPHRSTLDRHLRRRGASRRQLRVLGEKRTIKMRFESFGDLWVGDYHHGPKVLAPDGRVTTAKLGAFIDHTTRYPVADRWYLSEDLASLRDTLLRALLTWGVPRLAYADRGAVYRSDQLAYSLAAIDSRLVHSKPYYSQGRGVIERWWKLADAFQHEVEARDELLTIHELNRFWEAFRTMRYLDAVHSELGITPARAVVDVVRRPLDPAVAQELFLVRVERTVHAKDACVSIEGQRFLCDSSLRSRKVDVRYDPRDLSSVLIYVDKTRVGRAKPQPIGRTETTGTPPAPASNGPKTDYLGMLRSKFDERLVENASAAAYTDLAAIDPGFDEARFLSAFADVTDARVRGAEAEEVHAFWQALGPLPESLVRVGLDHGVRLRGTGRHVRVYLSILRTFVLARMQAHSSERNSP